MNIQQPAHSSIRAILMALIKEYFRLSKEAATNYGPKTVLLMQVGAFYECYGKTGEGNDRDMIDEFCRTCELACANKAPGVVMAGFRDYSLEKYLNRLQEAGYTTVVHDQDAQIKEERALSGVYSPGTFFTGESAALSNCVACIWLERMRSKTVIGMANIDVFTGRSSVFEVETELMHAHTTYDELERFISAHTPSEVILITDNFSQKQIEDLENFAGIATCARLIHRLDSTRDTVQKSRKQVYQREIMSRFFGASLSQSLVQFASYEFATQALTYLLNFVHEHNPHLVHRISEPAFENCSDRMVLANHSLKQLNIIDDDNGTKSKYSSVYKLLNNCMTPMGARHFRTRLLNPSCSMPKIQREYDITEHLLLLSTTDVWRPQLAQLKDLEKFNRLIMMRKCPPQMLHALHGNLSIIHDLHSSVADDAIIASYARDTNPLTATTAGATTHLESVSDMCTRLRQHMGTAFHMDKCANVGADLGDCDFVRPGIHAGLDTLRAQNAAATKTLHELRNYLDSLIVCGEKSRSNASDVVKVHETEKGGISLQATKRRTKLLADQIKQQKLDQVCICDRWFSLLSLTYPAATGANNEITSPQLSDLCRSIIVSNQKIKEIVGQIYADFVDKLRDWEPVFQHLIHFATTLDLLQNQCHIAVKYKFCKPVLVSGEGSRSFFDARDLRHCLIERLNEDETYVANDVALGSGEGTSSGSGGAVVPVGLAPRGMLIYGTNAVGKTSLIRAIGIAIIMAQAGLYVPCSSLKYHPYTTIFTRILGNDNLFKGLSTFQVEMSELRVILRTATDRSLILGDELCSGTEMDSAIAIFVAGLSHLHRVGCTFLFATHMHEINGYDEVRLLTKMCMKHLTVVYDKSKDTLIYNRKLADGPGASMYGLEVCKALHLPDAFLEFANAVRLRHRARPSDIGILSFEPSHFNAHKLKGVCERCSKELAQEIHHLLPQKDADSRNYIGHVPKNHVANLMALCTRCHDEVHSGAL
jgi:DNA mismatch repair protein MutS